MARPVGKAEIPRDTREDWVYDPLQVQEPGGAPDVWHHIAAVKCKSATRAFPVRGAIAAGRIKYY